MNMVYTNNQQIILSRVVVASVEMSRNQTKLPKINLNLLQPLRQWLDQIEICDRKVAEFIYKAIPSSCPFARDIYLFGRKIAHIPPLCKLNPLYDQLMGLRFRALCYLVDECGVDMQCI